MTRERKRESLFALLGETCPMCHGTGSVVSKESLFIQVNTELEQLKLNRHHGKVQIRLNTVVAEYFKTRLQRLQKAAGDKVEVKASDAIDWDDYQIIVE